MRDLKLWIPLLAFLVSFAATYPGSIVLKDEAKYLRQANAFANGTKHVEYINPVTKKSSEVLPSDYPPGTSLMASFFIYIGGWKAGFWMSAIGLFIAVFLTAKLLQTRSYDPWYAILFLFFPPGLVMARLVTSDVISAAIVALGWLLFWKGLSGNQSNGKKISKLWFFSGLVAGFSLLFRETNALLFAPLFVGALLRRDNHWIWLLIGGLIGSFVRLYMSYIIFGDPLFFAGHSGFSLDAIFTNLLFYIPALTIFAPGGLIFSAIYRGKRTPEVITTVFLFLSFYLIYNFSGESSGFLKRLVLGPRFFIPLLPVLAFVTAESAPRVLNSIFPKFSLRQSFIRGCIIVLTVGIILTNVLFHEWAQVHENIQKKITEYVPENSAVITNFQSTLKYVSELQGYHSRINFNQVSPDQVEQIGEAYVVFLQRSESSFWRETAESENHFLKSIPAEPVFNQKYLNNYHLKIYKTDY